MMSVMMADDDAANADDDDDAMLEAVWNFAGANALMMMVVMVRLAVAEPKRWWSS